MKSLLFICLAVAVTPTCHRTSLPPPPSDVSSAPALNIGQADRLSQISAQAEAAEHANEHQPPGPTTEAVAGPLSVIRALAGPATPAHRAAAFSVVDDALKGNLQKANAGWAQAREEGTALTKRIAALEKQVADERLAAAAELQRQLKEADERVRHAEDEARQKAEARENAILTYFTFGLGTLLVLGGFACLALKAYVPLIGTQVAFWLGAAGGALILIGIAVRAINRLVQDHPYIFWGGLLGAVVAVAVAAGLVISNHHHHVENLPEPAK